MVTEWERGSYRSQGERQLVGEREVTGERQVTGERSAFDTIAHVARAASTAVSAGPAVLPVRRPHSLVVEIVVQPQCGRRA